MKDIWCSNLTKEEQNALKELKGDSEVIIFEANEEGTVVVIDLTYYADKILKIPNDSQTYEKIPTNTEKKRSETYEEVSM